MLHIHKLTIPNDHYDVHWQNYCRLGNLHAHECIGGPEWDSSAEETLTGVHRWEDECRFHYWVAYRDHEPVGTAYAFINARVDPTAGHLAVYVLPEHRRAGIAAGLVEELEGIVQAEGLVRLKTSLMASPPTRSTEQIVPTTGVGAVPADHPGVRFALRHGFALKQIERYSRYDFAGPPIDPHGALDQAQCFAGDDYEVVTWAGAAPEEFLSDLTVLRRHLISDAPSGELEVAEDVWDTDRMREAEKQDLFTSELWAAAATHHPSSQIVALSYLSRLRSKPEGFIEQKGTVVLPEHRGRRLGTLVKAANLLRIRETVPNASAIMTSNAEENRSMLDINEALGFQPYLVEASFQRLL